MFARFKMAASMIRCACRRGHNLLKICVQEKPTQKELSKRFLRPCIVRAVPYSTEAQKKDEQTDLPEVEISTEEFKFVERLLPYKTIPEPPKHDNYPTPSGWIPPKDSVDLPYAVRRTKNHMMPVYHKIQKNSRQITSVRRIEGDIWKFEADLRGYLTEVEENPRRKPIRTQVHEVARIIRVKGYYMKEIGQFLIDKGF